MASSFAGGDTVVCQSSPYLTTGIISGLELQASAGGTTFTIAEGRYQVINMTDIENITFDVFDIGPADFVNVPVPDIAITDFTYVFLDGSGAIFTKSTPPILDDVIEYAYLGNLSHPNSITLTEDATPLGWVAYNSTLTTTRREFIEGTKRYFGLEFDFAGNGVNPILSEGETYRLGSNRLIDPTKPNVIFISQTIYGALAPGFVTLSVISDGGVGVIVNPDASIDFSVYDGGGGALIPVGNNNYANHFFYLFPTSAGGYFLFHEYGKANYTNLDDAVIASSNEDHFSFLGEAAYIGVISARNNVLDIDLAIIAGDAIYTPGNTVRSIYTNVVS